MAGSSVTEDHLEPVVVHESGKRFGHHEIGLTEINLGFSAHMLERQIAAPYLKYPLFNLPEIVANRTIGSIKSIGFIKQTLENPAGCVTLFPSLILIILEPLVN